ncbi:MAG: YceI family protein [Comamonadaceae bacterium]|nr:MAG: YceI family protein [Comamonadaceae bacterium]
MNFPCFRSLVLAALLAASAVAHAEPAATVLLPDKSRIAFVSKQMGVPVEGSFGRFTAQVAFDPRKPEGGSIALSIDMGSASLGVPQSDAELPKPEWFHAAKFPQAAFRSRAIKGLGGGQFEIAGQLTIKGQAQDIVVPVTITQAAGGQSVATGGFTIQRLAFKIGDGEWTDTSMVANDVQVRFRLLLIGLGPL